ncbi:IMP-specific 5'-nucleotidase 1 [Wickerhamomyces ciferrii]|uniref:IMP-specific 5'-nucleotidase 1 n=1 Tax=Wickerhamomyces ciferrii (strain ATCC 14091 / BCRC 22168 / CBS 111 / JCM 3599 / NBRC 0793 / NRRL Y-1031 F-60-10) TaxID=1206466 RepID=K0KQX6_WICCF|nr:IMP-specific 5'-nucleotidase 1 [Wickerhamomyces ciferrii]CCH43714.1 IMP-specific 5'-nucleotidase 1 [Wickerhamomyces ciferrii]
MDRNGTPQLGRLQQLVPSISGFFTKLPLEKAFYIEDERRSISVRRLVAPSFNDIRLILNTAQALALAQSSTPLKLVTFDGDVTLYEDGKSLAQDAKVVPRLINLLSKDIIVGVVTAAGYNEPSGDKYYARLKGLIDAIVNDTNLTKTQKENFTVMGGESNYLFRYDDNKQGLLWVDPKEWLLETMASWDETDILNTLDLAQSTLKGLQKSLNLPAYVIRKHRGVGLVPNEGIKLSREQLEEVVLSTQKRLEISQSAQRIKFCAFDGGADVWVDIASKDLGVESLQRYFGNIKPNQTLHIGDQFSSVGSNDFKARLAGCTVWIANPEETVQVLDDLDKYMIEEEAFR